MDLVLKSTDQCRGETDTRAEDASIKSKLYWLNMTIQLDNLVNKQKKRNKQNKGMAQVT